MASAPRTFTVPCKSLMTASKIPSIDYAVNPYLGCTHGCVYCYATFMARFADIEDEWGTFVGIKKNAPDVLGRELCRKRPGVVTFGTVCDAYQTVEEERLITRACLEAFVGTRGFDVGVLTKSDLVVRDVDVLSNLESADVGFSITCLDAGLAGIFEPGAPSPSRRLAAMRALSGAGVSVWGFFGPVLPTISDDEDSIAEVLGEMKRGGAGRVLVDSMTLYPKVWSRVRALFERSFPERLDALLDVRAHWALYESRLSGAVESAARDTGVEVDICF
jgi:DNA repair photolyase